MNLNLFKFQLTLLIVYLLPVKWDNKEFHAKFPVMIIIIIKRGIVDFHFSSGHPDEKLFATLLYIANIGNDMMT